MWIQQLRQIFGEKYCDVSVERNFRTEHRTVVFPRSLFFSLRYINSRHTKTSAANKPDNFNYLNIFIVQQRHVNIIWPFYFVWTSIQKRFHVYINRLFFCFCLFQSLLQNIKNFWLTNFIEKIYCWLNENTRKYLLFGLVSLFNGIITFWGYLMPNSIFLEEQ